MNNLKKILALVVAVAMLASFGCVASAAGYTDVATNASYADAVNLLSNLGIIQGFEDGTFRPDDTLTRAQAAAIMVRMLGLESSVVKGATEFSDVPATHWASGYVNVAANSNIIKGYGDGNFYPEEAVTYEQIVKMIMVALGYEIAAEANGGYPSGYLYMASSTNTGVSKNVAGVVGEAASRAIVAKLVYNALEVELMDQTSFSTGINGNNWTVLRGKTVLSEYLELEKIDGVVVDSYLSNSQYEDGDDTVSIVVTKNYSTNENPDYDVDSRYNFVADATDAATLLGYSVVAYVGENDDGDDEVYAISEKAGRNSATVIDKDSIKDGNFTLGNEIVDDKDNTEVTYKQGEVEYYKSESSRNTVTANITNRVYPKSTQVARNVVINGFNNEDYTNDFLTTDGDLDVTDDKFNEVTLLDNNNDGDFEFVFVTLISDTDAEEFVVDNVDLEENIINGVEDESLELDYDDENKLITIIRDGEIVNLDQIQADDVVTVLDTSVNVETVYVSSNVISGVVEEVEDDEEFTIGGQVYKISQIQLAKAEGIKNEDFNPGDEGKFYINYDGKIAYRDTVNSVSGADYVYVIDAAMIQGDFNDNSYALKVINANGLPQTLYFKKTKVHIHADGYDENQDYKAEEALEEVEKLLPAEDGYDVGAQGLAKVDTNAQDQITDIYIPGAVDSESDFKLNARYANDADDETRSYSSARGTYGVFDVPTSTVLFNLDKTEEDLEDAVTAATVGGIFVDDSSYSFTAYFEKDDIKAVVTTDAKTGFDPEAPVMVVTSNRRVSANDEETQRLTGIVAGESVTITVDPDDDGEAVDVVPGNVVIYSKDASGFATDVTILLASDENGVDDTTPLKGTENGKIVTEPDEKNVNVAFGKVLSKERTYFTLDDGKLNPITGDACAYVAAEGGCNYTLVEFGRNLSVKASSSSAVRESTGKYDIYVFVKTVEDSCEEVTDVVVFRVSVEE